VELTHENDIFMKSSYRVGPEPNALASTVQHPLEVTADAPEWLHGIALKSLVPESFHMLKARNDADVLIRMGDLPLLTRGQFGKGTTFAYLGFSPTGQLQEDAGTVVLDRLVRASPEARLFTSMCAIILGLTSADTTAAKLADIIDSRDKVLFQTLAEMPSAGAPRVSATWRKGPRNHLSGHIRVENGERYAFGLRVRLQGPDDQSGRALQVWSNQYFDLLPHQKTEADVSIFTRDGTAPGPLTLIVEDMKEQLSEQRVDFTAAR
jgi:hypothetical protein